MRNNNGGKSIHLFYPLNNLPIPSAMAVKCTGFCLQQLIKSILTSIKAISTTSVNNEMFSLVLAVRLSGC